MASTARPTKWVFFCSSLQIELKIFLISVLSPPNQAPVSLLIMAPAVAPRPMNFIFSEAGMEERPQGNSKEFNVTLKDEF
jgi:hypothetical protein